jgi:hypothetical protein
MVEAMPSGLTTVAVGTPISAARIFVTSRRSSEPPVRSPPIRLTGVEGPFFSEILPLISLGFLVLNLGDSAAGALEFAPR